MQKISAQVERRLVAGIEKFQPILRKAKISNRNESDTVTIIVDILCEVFGYDKYDHITSELQIKRTYCDLAIKLDSQVRLLIECKAIGIDLREEHVSQATSYAANAGIDWVILTNGIDWRIYRVIFSKPVDIALVYEFDFCSLNVNQPADIVGIYSLCLEAFGSKENTSLDLMYSQRKVLNKYIVGQLMLNNWMVNTIRRSLQRHFPSVKITDDELRRMMQDEVFRREITDGEKANDAAHIVAAANARMRAEQKAKKGAVEKPVET